MSFADQGRVLWRLRWFIVVAMIASVALGVVLATRQKSTSYAAAESELLIDSVPSSFAELNPAVNSVELVDRAPLYAEYATSADVVRSIAAKAGLPADSLSVSSAAGQTTPTQGVNTVSAANLPTSGAPGGGTLVTLADDGINPLLYVSVSSDSLATAARVAQATDSVMVAAIRSFSVAGKVPGGNEIALRQLGTINAYTVNQAPKVDKPILAGAGLFVVLLILMLLIANISQARAQRRAQRGAANTPGAQQVSA